MMDITSTTIGYSALCALFIALMAQISFNLPKSISTVPITMQTFAINLIPLLFGLKIAVLSSIFYYIAIGYGLPVGASGEGGYKKLYGPTGGYLVGFILASIQIGIMYQDNPENILMPLIIGNLIIFAAGVMWLPFGLSFKTGNKLSNYTNIKDLLMWGFIPFIPGDLIKIALAVAVKKVFD
mmetsp:Transcript_9000/g.8091  ORF Transcript_9000/g.8091 Transcript_9000/m.8091 type:complete len:182 (+) Transcript_9000:102-647(+)